MGWVRLGLTSIGLGLYRSWIGLALGSYELGLRLTSRMQPCAQVLEQELRLCLGLVSG